MVIKFILKLVFSVIVLLLICLNSSASNNLIVFKLNEHSQPIVSLERIHLDSEGVKAILALYALENGAGCEGRNEQGLLNCKLTSKLGLGANCSDNHIALVRTWFNNTPKLTSRWHERWNKKTKTPGTLEDLCYRQPDTGSWHNVWEVIKLRVEGDIVSVDAVQTWGSQFGHGKVRYMHRYQLRQNRVKEISAEITELMHSSESIF
jgi:hypothetical protein